MIFLLSVGLDFFFQVQCSLAHCCIQRPHQQHAFSSSNSSLVLPSWVSFFNSFGCCCCLLFFLEGLPYVLFASFQSLLILWKGNFTHAVNLCIPYSKLDSGLVAPPAECDMSTHLRGAVVGGNTTHLLFFFIFAVNDINTFTKI